MLARWVEPSAEGPHGDDGPMMCDGLMPAWLMRALCSSLCQTVFLSRHGIAGPMAKKSLAGVRAWRARDHEGDRLLRTPESTDGERIVMLRSVLRGFIIRSQLTLHSCIFSASHSPVKYPYIAGAAKYYQK